MGKREYSYNKDIELSNNKSLDHICLKKITTKSKNRWNIVAFSSSLSFINYTHLNSRRLWVFNLIIFKLTAWKAYTRKLLYLYYEWSKECKKVG